MSVSASSHIDNLLQEQKQELLKDWVKEQLAALHHRKDLMEESEVHQQSTEFLNLLQEATHKATANVDEPEWNNVKQFLKKLSYSRTQQGFSSSDTTNFIFSLKQPLIKTLNERLENDPNAFIEALKVITLLLDKLGLYTIEVYQISREDIIRRQQEEMLELSTPVIKLWEGVLAIPMIGTLDSGRTQIVMENLLQRIVETNCEMAIIDITGVPNVDTLVAQHLLKTVTAAKLMGAECIISGIRPQIAQTIVHLGVNLEGITTKATLADAFLLALTKMGQSIHKRLASKSSEGEQNG